MGGIECVVQANNRLGESPVWCDRKERLYWVDGRAPAIHWYEPSTGVTAQRPVAALIGSIGLRRDVAGSLVAALQTGFHFLDAETGVAVPIIDPEADIPTNRFNDGRCDRAGRFWAGTMSDVRRDPTGALYCLTPDRSCRRVFGDVIVPNGIAWSPDSGHMYFADTYRSRMTVFDFRLDDGTLGPARLFCDTSSHPGRPDGSAVDAEGCVWNAEYGGWRVVRYTPDGRIDRVIALPVSCPTSCAFGGHGLDTLFITSARQRLTPDELARQPLAGSVFALTLGVRGLPEGRFGL